MKNQFFGLIALLALALAISSCKKEDDVIDGFGSVEIEFDHRAGGLPLNFGAAYTTANGDEVKFTTFNYFVSNVVLIKEDGTEYIVPKDESYFLIKHIEPNSREIKIDNVPAGNYTGVRFMIGVDSAKSVSPAAERIGVLDPATGASGMYWSWNAGYIFVKVEGESPQAPDNPALGGRLFQYHTGLFGGLNSPTLNNIKTVELSLHHGESATVRKDKGAPHFHMLVDILEMFTNPTNISIATTPTSHAGPYSATVAENYKDMFTLDHVHNP